MSYQVVFHAAIAKDYNEAYEWYERKSAGHGEKFLAAVRNKVHEISEHPEYYSEKSKKGYREAKG